MHDCLTEQAARTGCKCENDGGLPGPSKGDLVVHARRAAKNRGGGEIEFSISYLYSGLLYSWISQMACI